MANFEKVSVAVFEGNLNNVVQLVKECIDNKIDPLDIINKGLIAGMSVVGQRFKAGDMYVPEVLMAAKAMRAGVDVVKPLIAEGEIPNKGTIVIGTVKGDLHDIGKNLVGMMMESSGFQVINLGVDISPERFAAAVKEHKPQVVGMSALLTTTMLAMKDTIEVLTEEGIRDSVKVIIGGAPVTADFAKEIGADGFAPDAASAAELAENLINS
ncbi:MAG: corrinoid protein [Clostridia bacterium]|jgi:5-methyltetrahydrofolate--homocysteine methyltransferase|nr:corrinoid protein [Clostridia bacterium]